MTRRGGYRRLAPGSEGPGVCPVHRLLNYTEIEAKIDAGKLREQATHGRAEKFAEARPCDHGNAWHIFIPTKGRARTLRRNAKQVYRR